MQFKAKAKSFVKWMHRGLIRSLGGGHKACYIVPHHPVDGKFGGETAIQKTPVRLISRGEIASPCLVSPPQLAPRLHPPPPQRLNHQREGRESFYQVPIPKEEEEAPQPLPPASEIPPRKGPPLPKAVPRRSRTPPPPTPPARYLKRRQSQTNRRETSEKEEKKEKRDLDEKSTRSPIFSENKGKLLTGKAPAVVPLPIHKQPGTPLAVRNWLPPARQWLLQQQQQGNNGGIRWIPGAAGGSSDESFNTRISSNLCVVLMSTPSSCSGTKNSKKQPAEAEIAEIVPIPLVSVVHHHLHHNYSSIGGEPEERGKNEMDEQRSRRRPPIPPRCPNRILRGRDKGVEGKVAEKEKACPSSALANKKETASAGIDADLLLDVARLRAFTYRRLDLFDESLLQRF